MARTTIMTDSPVERLLGWERGERPGPWYVTLFPTNRCNLRCAICWQRAHEVDRSTEVSDDRLIDLVDECADLGAREWAIVGGGEPMMRPHLVISLCERIRARGMNGTLQTNAVAFDPQHLARLVEIEWAKIAISLDGPTREINDAIRGEGSFDKITATVRSLAALKREHQATAPSMCLHAALTCTNYDTLDQLAELAHALGCDGVGAGELIVEGDQGKAFQLQASQRAGLPEHVRRAAERAKQLGLWEYFSSLPGRPTPAYLDRMERRLLQGGGGIVSASCYEPWLGLTVLADGKAGPCCVFWDAEAQNVRECRTQDVWVGSYLQGVRQAIREGRAPRYCAWCPSGLRSRDEAFRRQLLYARMSGPQRLAYLTIRGIIHTRQHGLMATLRRGRDRLLGHGRR